jgi:TRAP-type C4-dicarboxylate transport system permease small subunit
LRHFTANRIILPIIWGIMRNFLDRLYLYAGYTAGIFMIVIFVLMMVLSAGRPLGINVPAGDDLVAWSMAAMSFLGLAHTFRSGEMIRVGLLIDRIEGRMRWWIEICALVVGCGFIGFFTWHALRMTYDSFRFNDMAQGVLAVPLWIPQLGYSGGLALLLIAFLDELIYVGCGNPPRYEKPKPQTAEEVVEQAIQSAV